MGRARRVPVGAVAPVLVPGDLRHTAKYDAMQRPDARAAARWPALGLLRHDVDATADHGADQAFVSEHLDRLLNGAACYLVLLCQTIDRRQGTARRKLAALDLTSQDGGKLQVDRHIPFVINRHMSDCRRSWKLAGRQGFPEHPMGT